MNATIIFGTKRLGQNPTTTTNDKYADLAVVTIEGQKGAKKSRRILLNTKAAELLNCEVGTVQQLVLASVEMGDNSPKRVLLANAANLGSEVDVTYKTSKNRVSFGEDTSEKGKAISSTHACNEIFNFLERDDSTNIEFKLTEFDSTEVEAYALSPIVSSANLIETNTGEISVEEVTELVINEVATAELNDPIMEEKVQPDEEVQPDEPVREEVETSEWA